MTTQKIQASLASYDVNLLMTQTRKLASDYRRETGQALPVTEELARFDAINILGLIKKEGVDGIDAISANRTDGGLEDKSSGKDESYLIKGRVIFKGGKARQKLGRISLQAAWTRLLMVIYDAEYLPSEIYVVKREIIDKEMNELHQDKRGSMTVAKYKAIGELIWENSDLSQAEQPISDKPK